MRWRIKRARKSERWRPWFAWRPVEAVTPVPREPGRRVRVWLELIERRREHRFRKDGRWSYRTRGGWGV